MKIRHNLPIKRHSHLWRRIDLFKYLSFHLLFSYNAALATIAHRNPIRVSAEDRLLVAENIDVESIRELNPYRSLGWPILLTDTNGDSYVIKLRETQFSAIRTASTIYREFGLQVPEIYELKIPARFRNNIVAHVAKATGAYPSPSEAQILTSLRSDEKFLIMPFYTGTNLGETIRNFDINSSEFERLIANNIVPALAESFVVALISGNTDSIFGNDHAELLTEKIQINEGSFLFSRSNQDWMHMHIDISPQWMVNSSSLPSALPFLAGNTDALPEIARAIVVQIAEILPLNYTRAIKWRQMERGLQAITEKNLQDLITRAVEKARAGSFSHRYYNQHIIEDLARLLPGGAEDKW